jgi:NADH-quinone oxidoreductase subunit C
MTPERIAARLAEALGEHVVLETVGERIRIVADELLAAIALLREERTIALDLLDDLWGFDRLDLPPDPEPLLELRYHLRSSERDHGAVVTVRIPREGSRAAPPTVASLAATYPSALLLERESHDLLGIHFEGHPDLRRILCPEDWSGHPLRRDWEAPESVHGRPNHVGWEELIG